MEDLQEETVQSDTANDDLNEEISTVESTQSIDATKYEGKRIPIVHVRKLEVIDPYTENDEGKRVYDANSTIKKMVIEIETEPLKELDADGKETDQLIQMTQEDGTTKNVTIKRRFNLKKGKNKVNEIVWGMSKHEKATLWKFMRKMGVTDVRELKSKIITLTAVPARAEDDDRMFLSIVV